ncbi:MAG TPA: GatB/YqeY domain-containing protein [Terriglobales bacterium]|nr:GatB/YqeY domain-containing protein [Terriglobales bacterium]
MATEAQLNDDLKTAMKARDMETVYVLRGLLTAIKTVKVEKLGAELSEGEIAGLVRKEINKRAEAADFARKADRKEQEESNRREQAILEKYMPKQLDAETLEQTLRGIAAELGTTQLGPVMAKLKERFPGQYDGKLASELARKLI